MNYKRILPILISSLVLFSGCSSKSATTSAPAEKPITVSVYNVQNMGIQNVNSVVGKVIPAQEISVYSKTPGKISKVYVGVGESVKKGQPLFMLDDKDINLQISQADAALSSAKANLARTKGGSMELQLAQLKSSLASAEINLNDAKTSLEGNKSLYNIEAISKQTLDAAENRYKTALEQYNSAKKAVELTESQINNENIASVETQVTQSQTAYDMARSQLDNVTVTSPIDGIVSSRNIDEAEMVSSAAPAVTIVDISTVMVEINVLEDMVNRISLGNKYEVLVKSLSEKPYVGEVVSISPNADARTQTYLVKLSIQNTEGKLKGGMLADVKMITQSKENVLAVPIDAVVNENGKKVVYLANDDEAVRKEVTVGLSNEKYIEVSGDIKQNDKVIVKGQNFIKDKSKVVVTE